MNDIYWRRGIAVLLSFLVFVGVLSLLAIPADAETQNYRLLSDRNSAMAALLGSFFAGAIAVWSVSKTKRNADEIEEAKRAKAAMQQVDLYFGHLFALEPELQMHRLVLVEIAMELPEVRGLCIERGEFILTKMPHLIPLEFAKKIRTKILDFDRYNTTTLSRISAYINSCEFLNTNLDFRPLIQVHQIRHVPRGEIVALIGSAFDALLDGLARIVLARTNLRATIIDEIGADENNNLFITDDPESENIEMWGERALRI